VIIYGRNPVREALRGRRAHTLAAIWATPAVAREPWLEGMEPRGADAQQLTDRCGSAAHQGICAELGEYPYGDAHQLLLEPVPLLVVLDQIQDPQNLGSICRTAECAGAAGLVIGERRCAQVTPAACKASAGALEHLIVAKVRNVADFLLDARRAGCWCYGASPAGSTSYQAPDYSGGVVLVLGSEGRGLRPRVANSCDQLISLPTLGKVDSLGVSAAAAAILYRILHDRSPGLDKVR
jgi:23S rRNA (guanosine2251-2'-O)-methyltransferase